MLGSLLNCFFHRAVTCPQLELPHLGEALWACPWKSPKYAVLSQDLLQESLVSHDLSRKFHKCLNLLVLVLGFAGRVLKKVGVGVLRGNSCESQAPYFSSASAKGEGPVGGKGRENNLEPSVPIPTLKPALRGQEAYAAVSSSTPRQI